MQLVDPIFNKSFLGPAGLDIKVDPAPYSDGGRERKKELRGGGEAGG